MSSYTSHKGQVPADSREGLAAMRPVQTVGREAKVGFGGGPGKVMGRAMQGALLGLTLIAGLGSGALAQGPALPAVPVPPGNPITEPKRILGKALFWDEQLSSDNTMACATCHQIERSGTDPRRQRHPGFDNLFNTPDDVLGSPGVIRADTNDNYKPDNAFVLGTQATIRAANTALMAAFAPESFWDGRAGGTLRDPETNAVVLASGAALENQVLQPPLSDVEMAHEDRNWAEISAKLQSARPLALATALTNDLASAISGGTTYGDLFRNAFGDSAVTPVRIAMAIATYERTLIPNQTPWDRFNAGQQNALTPGQQQGLQILQASNCTVCHVPPQFTGNGFRNIGLRPPQEDLGRQIVTGNPGDRGRFKVPSLRNVGLKNTFMHNGMFTTLGQVIGFYARAPGAPQQFPDNRDPVMQNVNVPPQAVGPLTDFLVNGLTDPRVAAREFPFDHPNLWSSRPGDRPAILPGGVAGTSGIPSVIAVTPGFVGNTDFKVGIQNALGNAPARLAVSFAAPVNGRVVEDKVVGPVVLAGTGYGTAKIAIASNGSMNGRAFFVQWIVTDPAAAGGEARSAPVRVTPFCGGAGCPPTCIADVDDGSSTGWPDGGVGTEDLLFYLSQFGEGGSLADVDDGSSTGTRDGGIGIEDLLYYLNRYDSGC